MPKKIKMIKNIVLAGLLTACFAAHAETVPDIAGVKLRMPLASQKALIEKVNPQYQFSEIKTSTGKVVGIEGVAVSAKTRAVVDQFLALQDDAGNIWFLGRAQKYEEGNYIPKATFVAAFKEKYGTPTDLSPDNGNFSWSYDRNTTLQAPKTGTCPFGAGGSVTSPRTEMSKLRNDSLYLAVPSVFEPNCGIVMHGKINAHYKDNMIVGSTIQIVDHKTRYDVLEKKKMAEDAARQKELDAMKGNKPKL
jgi:hypothetical protein